MKNTQHVQAKVIDTGRTGTGEQATADTRGCDDCGKKQALEARHSGFCPNCFYRREQEAEARYGA